MKSTITTLFAFALLLFAGVVSAQNRTSNFQALSGNDAVALKMKDIELDPGKAPYQGTLLTVAPNPVSDAAQIQFIFDQTTNVTLRVFDVMGKEVFSNVNGDISQGSKYSVSMDVANLAPGMYFVNLSDAKGKGMTTRFIVAH